MEKELSLKAKSYLIDKCYAQVYTKYFNDTDELFIRFTFDGIEVKITVEEFIMKLNRGYSISDLMDDALKQARFVLCNILTNRYFNL